MSAIPVRSNTSEILRNALSLFGTTIVTSACGFVFWWVAAHLFSRAAVGSGSAAISALQLLGMTGVLGLGTLLIGELSKRPPEASALLTTALVTATLFGIGLGLGFAFLMREVSPSAHEVPDDVAGMVAFISTVGITAALLVLDDATVGLSRAHWQLLRNLAFSVLKLAVLPLAALGLSLGGSTSLIGSWLVGAVLSAILLGHLARRSGLALLASPRWNLLHRYGRTALTHHWLNLASVGPRYLLPVLVAAFLTPVVNASFYVTLLCVNFAYIIPSHLSTALFAIASGDRHALTQTLRHAVRISALAGVGSALFFALLGGPLLSLFGHGYGDAAGVLAILGVATFPSGVRALYMAVCRVNGDLGRCAVICCSGSALEIALPLVALVLHTGLVTVALSWVIAMTIEAILLWPAVAEAAQLSTRLPIALNELVRWTAPRTFEAVTL